MIEIWGHTKVIEVLDVMNVKILDIISQAECPTFLKWKKKSFTVTLSNKESSSDSDGEEVWQLLLVVQLKNKGAFNVHMIKRLL